MKHVQLAFNLTGRCNLKCAYCATRGGELKVPDLKSEIIMSGYKKIRRKYPNLHLDLNCIGNGEPLLNWEAIKTIDNIKSIDKRVRCFITTNGTFQDKILELAKKNWIITISYDGINNDQFREKSHIVEDTIEKLAKNNVKFLVRMTIFPESLANLNNSLYRVKKLGGKYVVLGPIFPFGRYKKGKSNLSFDLNKLYNSIKYAESIGLKIILTIQEACTLATRGFYLMPDGKISICYVKNIKPTAKNRHLASEQGCLLMPYKNLLK